MKRAALTIVTTLLVSAPAPAVTLVHNGNTHPQPFQRWAKDTVAQPSGSVEIHLANCPGQLSRACVTRDEPLQMFLGVRDKWTFIHELGHVFDTRMMTPAYRSAYRRVTDQRSGQWLADDGRMDSPGEQFASDYADCAMADPESIDQRVCRLIRRAARSARRISTRPRNANTRG